MIARLVTIALILSAAAGAEVPKAVYPLAPAGQGVNGDWANLGQYREANRAIRSHGPSTVVFMGDSITWGWAKQAAFADDVRRVGRGIRGQTTAQMLVRFRADVIDLQPAVVHIMAGTNDLAGNTGPVTDAEIEGNIASMVELAQAHGIKVVIASILPSLDFPWHPGLEPGPRIQRINAWLKDYAARKQVVYVDYASVLAATDGAMKPEYSADGVHPNAIGFAAIEPLAKAAIDTALKAK